MKSQLLFLIKRLISNKVIIYLLSRYVTYFLQFITSIIIAVKLGPYYFGIWGFILLLINYFQITNFGISNSLNILMVQNKNNLKRTTNYVATSIILIAILGVLVVLFTIYYKIFGISLFNKYEINNLIYFISLIAICFHFNNLFVTIYRVKNSLFEVAFYQSIIPLLVFIAMFFAKDRILLIILLIAYLFGHTISFLLFMRGKLISFNGKPSYNDAKEILFKGIHLFVYNICFYLIIVTTRTIISIYFSIEEFGFFTFSFTLAHSVVLFLDALTFVVFPKLIDLLNSPDTKQVKDTIKAIRINYVGLSHGIIYIALLAFPIFLKFIPKYQDTFITLNLIALTVVLGTNFFGYSSFLMARNQDKTIAVIAFFSLLINISIALGLIYIFHVSYVYIIFATMFSYFVFSFLCAWFANKLLNQKLVIGEILLEFFPFTLMIPFISAILIVLLNIQYLIFIPLIIFILLNIKLIKEFRNTIRKVILRPDFINIGK